jgi:hypothetical protein
MLLNMRLSLRRTTMTSRPARVVSATLIFGSFMIASVIGFRLSPPAPVHTVPAR